MIGNIFSHYRITEEIGRGGMGEVYLAEDTKLERQVALKFLPKHLTVDKEARERFEREAKAAAALNHPNIVTIYEIGEHEGQVFIAMEYVEGQTLKDIISVGADPRVCPDINGNQKKGEHRGSPLPIAPRPLPLAQVLDIASQLASGLAAAHAKGIVHRDIKPANIFITSDGVVKILDFGLAKLTRGTRLTQTGVVSGTVAYMSPEQATGAEVDKRTDLWSLGVVMYEMLAGRHPFDAEYEQAAIYQLLNQDPESLTTLRSDLPGSLVQAVSGCLQKDKGKRIQDAKEVLELLANASQPSSTVGRKRTFPKKAAAAAGLTIVLAAAFFFIFKKGPDLPLNAKTIAVLPFIDLSNDPANAYFSDGVTEDILTQLSRLSDLRVISRTTMMQYKGTKKKLSEIGAELKAGVVLEGSVRRSGNRVRIAAQLIDAHSDVHLWADSYDRDLSDILAIQGDVAAKIASALKAALTPREKEALKNAPAVNPRAYTLLLEGRYLMQRYDKESNEKAIALFEQALAIDGADARVWAALAEAHWNKSFIYYDSSVNLEAEGAKVRQEAEKAVALDDNCPEAHRILGHVRLIVDWDWQGADAEFKRTRELDPNNVDNIQSMASLAVDLGRLDEALTLTRKSLDLDPVNPFYYRSYGYTLMALNRFDEALASMHKALDLNPQTSTIHLCLGWIFILQGKPEQALEEMRLEPDPAWRTYGLALAYADAGREKEADAALKELIREYKEWLPLGIAEVYAWRGQADKAFEWLEEAFRLRDGGLIEMKTDFWLRKLKSDPRYVQFLKKMNLDGDSR